MNPSTNRLCPSCGAPVREDVPCGACALAGAFDTLGFSEPASPPTTSARFSPIDLPSSFGHYRVEREIAAGGMGVVYEAEDTRLGRRVALKMLRHVFFATEVERLRFQSEAELTSLLDHPHIVPIHEVGEHEGQPYFTMKLIRGGNLADRLHEKSMPADEAAATMMKIASAVHHAHQHGVLHRDLKPANILLDENEEPLLTDFGLAKQFDSDSNLTLTQAIAGTPEYMAPEQAGGRKEEITTATDVWALGVIFYQMLTGRLPFQGESHPDILRQVAEHEPPNPSTIIHRIDRDLETLCVRCLEKDPTRRIASARELAEELQRWQRGEPVRARRITQVERLGKWVRRHPYRAAAMAAFLLVSLGAVTAITWQWRRATHNEQLAQASAGIEKRTAYSATLAQALAARENHEFGIARRLLEGIDPELRAFDWRLLQGLCHGDDIHQFQLGKDQAPEPQCLTKEPNTGGHAIISADGFLHLRGPEGKELAPARRLPDLNELGHRYYGLTYSPNGQRLAYANGDLLRVLDAHSLAVIHEETSVSPQFDWLDDHRLLYGFNGSAKAPPWPDAGAWILDFEGAAAAGKVSRIAFPKMCAPLSVSPDRRFFVLHRVIAKPTSWKRSLHRYRVGDDYSEIPETIYQLPGREYPGELHLSRDGAFLAMSAGPAQKRSARVLDLVAGRTVFDHQFRFPIHAIAMDQSSQLLGLVGDDSVVRVYDISRGAPEGVLAEIYDDDVAATLCERIDGRGALGPHRDLITRSAQDGRARFYLGHEDRVYDLAFDSPSTFVTASGDGSIRRWEQAVPRPGLRIGHLENRYDRYRPTASRDGRHLLFYRGNTWICDVARSRAGVHPAMHIVDEAHSPLVVLADGRPVTMERDRADIVVWEPGDESNRLEEALRVPGEVQGFTHHNRVERAKLSRDEQRLVGVLAGRLFTLDLKHPELGITWGNDLGTSVSSFADHAISPDGQWIASSDFGARVSIHRFEDPNEIVARLGGEPRGYDTAVAFGREGRRLYTGNEDGRLRAWDTATWKEIPEEGFVAHPSAITAIAVSHEGSLIATSGGYRLKLFPIQPEPGESYRRERLAFYREQPANWIQFARDEAGRDRALLHGSPGRTIEIWETNAMAIDTPNPVQGHLPEALVSHDAVRLTNGKVLVAGGTSDTKTPVARSAAYEMDPLTGVISATGSLGSPRWETGGLVMLDHGEILIAGGAGPEEIVLASCELYDSVKKSWAWTGAMAVARRGGGRLLLGDGRVLAVGGWDGDGNLLKPCELYDPDARTWSSTGPLNVARGSASYLTMADGTAVVIGGEDSTGQSAPPEVFDSATEQWKIVSSPGVDRSQPLAIGLPGNVLLVVGGFDSDKTVLASCERYDLATDSWAPVASLPLPLFGAMSPLSEIVRLPDGKILIAGGATGNKSNEDKPTAAAHLYDPDADAWRTAPALSVPQRQQSMVVLDDGRVLLVAGRDDRGPTSRVQFYDPR